MTDDTPGPGLVCCKECGAMRSAAIPICFCGSRETKAAPPATLPQKP